MSFAQKHTRQLLLRIAIPLVVVMLCLGGSTSKARQSGNSLPIVSAANVPFYPRTARMARIEGTVRLGIATDGGKVSAIEVESGQPMLVAAAKENVMTWKFIGHKPAKFDVTFRYMLLPQTACDMDNGVVTLHLPTEVRIAAKGWRTCDPAKGD